MEKKIANAIENYKIILPIRKKLTRLYVRELKISKERRTRRKSRQERLYLVREQINQELEKLKRQVGYFGEELILQTLFGNGNTKIK